MIYLVEDDENIRELVTYTLNNSNLETEGFGLPSQFWAALEQGGKPSLIMLDIMLPEEDGLSILKKLRSSPATKKIPIMMVTAKGSEYDKVIGLDNGADDYIAKPFGMMELIARVKALLRRTGKEETETEYTIGCLYVSPAKHIVQVDGKDVTLTYKEFELLSMFLKSGDVVLTRDRLLNEIWGYSFDGENRTVDVHIRTLRQKLGPAGDLIETVRGVGYKLGGKAIEK
ncbi:MAG: DNA-binding response regulator [Clostridiales bacterium]|jgi:two-component system alkaline phosphatase synthesis response regulator PhoP|nr:MAG: DNA-binding response regulator [Clostridiales bacterium]